MSTLRLLAIVAVLLAGPGGAAWAGAGQPAAEAPSVDEAHTFPFRFSAGKIYVEVVVNGKGPYPFVMDTGSPVTILDSDLAKELGMEVAQAGQVRGAGEGSAAMGMAGPVTLEFGGLKVARRKMMTVTLNQTLAPMSSGPVMGLIGNDWITTRVVEVDYPGRKITVRKAAGWEYEGSGTVIPTRTQGHTFLSGTITLPGEDSAPLKARFLLDTGAGLYASLTTPFVDKHRLLERAQPKFKTTVGFGLGGDVNHSVCRLARISLGGLTLEKPVCTLSQDQDGALAAEHYDGLIGGELLARYRVILDATRRRMILEPGPGAGEPFEFDMSGIVAAGNGGKGPLTAFRVVPGSPAAEAGVKEGDEILEIDGRAVRGSDRDEARALFKGDGVERTLKIRRGSETLEIRVRLRRMVGTGGSGYAAA